MAVSVIIFHLALTIRQLHARATQMRANQIELDLISGNFDETLTKYKPQAALSTVSTITPISTPVNPSLAELWEKFVEYKRPQCCCWNKRDLTGLMTRFCRCMRSCMSTRDIQAQLQDLYGVEVSAGLISNVALCRGRGAQTRRKIVVLIRFTQSFTLMQSSSKSAPVGRVINKAIHLALGVNLSGAKELLGMWMTQNESAKFWLQVLTELQNRGVKDIFIACVDGLTGFPDAICRCVSQNPGTNVHCSSGEKFLELRVLQRP
nr:IS256 family transposase [Scytonema millei]